MAAVLIRNVFQVSKRNVFSSASRLASMPDPVEHATGIEKRELLAKLSGIDDPFDMKVLKRGPGTKDCPNQVPSAFDARIIGCVCNEEATSMLPLMFRAIRAYAPYITLPVAAIIGIIGYNVENWVSDKYTPYQESISKKRTDRLLENEQNGEESLKEKKFVAKTVLDKNLSPSLQEKN